MNVVEALKSSSINEARRKKWSELTTLRQFGERKTMEVEMCAVGIETHLTLEDLLADDWFPVEKKCDKCGRDF